MRIDVMEVMTAMCSDIKLRIFMPVIRESSPVLPSMGQLMLLGTALATPKSKLHTLLIPAAVAVVSIVALLIHVVLITGPVKRFIARLRGRAVDDDDSPLQPIIRQHTGFFPDLRSHIKSHGGGAIFAWKMLRLLACMALTGLTIGAIIAINEGHKVDSKELDLDIDADVGFDLDSDVDALSKHWGKKHKKHKKKKRARWFSTTEWIEISLCMFYVSYGSCALH